MLDDSSRASNSNVPRRDFYYLSDEAAAALPTYQYHGEDNSLLYKYVLSPLATFLVNRCTPSTIAPNTITLLGLSFMISSYLLEWYFCPDLEPHRGAAGPGAMFLFNFFAMLMYQTLDNMDGKQARKTGSSSPLGLLFDHGCDAINSIFGSANWIIAIGLSLGCEPDVWMCWILILGPMSLFYVTTWEEYYTGKLTLPIINGPNEGMVLGALTSLTTCIYGVSYWQDTTWYERVLKPYLIPILPSTIRNMIPVNNALRNCDIQVLIATIGFIQETVSKTTLVVYSCGLKSTFDLLPFWTLLVCTFLIGLCRADILIDMPRTTLHLISGLFVEMSTHLMLDHITSETFQPLRWVLLPLVILTVLTVSGYISESSPQTDSFLTIYASSLWSYLLLKLTIIIHEACTVLNIWCFDIMTPRQGRSLSSVVSDQKHK
jgi:ethanolaminephosphotransferase